MKFVDGVGYRINAKGKKTYYVNVPENGRMRRYALKGVNSLTTAREKRRQLIEKAADQRHGIKGAESRIKLADLIERFLLEYVGPRQERKHPGDDNLKKREFAVKKYRWSLELLMAHIGDTRLAANITEDDAERFQAKIADARRGDPRNEGKGETGAVSGATVNRHIAAARKMFNWAIKRRLLRHNPFAVLEVHEEANRPHSPYSPETERRLLEIADARQPHYGPILRLEIWTGMRVGEVLAVKWEHIDFDNALLTLPQTKNGEERVVELDKDARLLPLLRGLHERADSDIYLFQNRKRSRLEGMAMAYTVGGMSHAFDRMRCAAGVPASVRQHDGRHTFAVRARRSGQSAEWIRTQAGWKSSSTYDRYSRMTASIKRDEISAAKVSANSDKTVTKLGSDRHTAPKSLISLECRRSSVVEQSIRNR